MASVADRSDDSLPRPCDALMTLLDASVALEHVCPLRFLIGLCGFAVMPNIPFGNRAPTYPGHS